MTVISEAAEVTIGKNGNKHKLKDCWITNETKALVEKRDKQVKRCMQLQINHEPQSWIRRAPRALDLARSARV